MKVLNLKTAVGAGFVLLLLNSGYISAFATPSIFYMANVLLHFVLGLALALAFAWLLKRQPDLGRQLTVPATLFAITLVFALWLVSVGNLREHRWMLNAHVVTSLIGVIALLPFLLRLRRISGSPRTLSLSVGNAALLAAALPLATAIYVKANPNPNDRIAIRSAAASMEEEGGGPKSPFWPSSAKTNVGGTIPSNFFMDSELCGDCHKDIYEQWNSSMHHFASFNNQFYRKSIEYMQSITGTQPSKWCAGCHDHAVFFNGRFDKPIKDQIDTPEAQNGLGCVSCHSIRPRRQQHGQRRIRNRIPAAPRSRHRASNKYIRAIDDFHDLPRSRAAPQDVHEAVHAAGFGRILLHVPQGPSRRAGEQVPLAPRLQRLRQLAGERRIRPGRAIVLLPAQIRPRARTATCRWSKSNDPGKRNGKIHSHRFATANTAVASSTRTRRS